MYFIGIFWRLCDFSKSSAISLDIFEVLPRDDILYNNLFAEQSTAPRPAACFRSALIICLAFWCSLGPAIECCKCHVTQFVVFSMPVHNVVSDKAKGEHKEGYEIYFSPGI